MRTGFDHDLYTRMQSDNIRSRIAAFGGKLYLELGGKLFDDFHASRVLPRFQAGQQGIHAAQPEGSGGVGGGHQCR